MRKFRFTTQLLILFGIIMAISSVLFSVLVVSRLSNVGENLTYAKLESYINITSNDWKSGTEVTNTIDDFEMAIIQGKMNVITPGDATSDTTPDPTNRYEILYISTNIADIIDQDNQFKLLHSISLTPGGEGYASQRLGRENNNNILYAYSVSDDGTFIVVMTNEVYSESIRDNIYGQMISIFIIVILLAALILGLWGGTYVSRTSRLQKHISNLKESNYEEEYLDGGKDELGELSKSVEEMRKQIHQNEETKQEMLQNLSHDFKTPIAVIKSYTEAIEDNMGDVKENTSIILKQTEILKSKVTKLLQYNKLEYLSKDKEFEDCNLADIIKNVAQTYKFQADIDIILDLEDTIFKGYQENYYTIIDNLFDNAKRYAKTKIVVSLKDRVFEIYNDGEHIDEQFLNGLFKPYEKGSKGQFGLGMSIVKKTCDFFGLELSVRNEEICGVTFQIKEKVIENVYLS